MMAGIHRPRNQEKSPVAAFLIVALFIVSLQPASLSILGSTVTANYTYVFIPFILSLMGVTRRLVRREQIVQILLIYSFIYLLGIPADILGSNYSIMRRLASFGVFVLPLFLAFVEFKPGDLSLFKISVILASVYYSLKSIVAVGSLSATVEVFQLKGLIGSQRMVLFFVLGSS